MHKAINDHHCFCASKTKKDTFNAKSDDFDGDAVTAAATAGDSIHLFIYWPN
jgi:hypothetical protein